MDFTRAARILLVFSYATMFFFFFTTILVYLLVGSVSFSEVENACLSFGSLPQFFVLKVLLFFSFAFKMSLFPSMYGYLKRMLRVIYPCHGF